MRRGVEHVAARRHSPCHAGVRNRPRLPPSPCPPGDEGVAKRKHMGFPEPTPEDQARAWKLLLDFFDSNLKH